MSFDEYMESEIPGYKSLLTAEEISSLEEFYKKKEFFVSSANSYLKAHSVPNKAVDYTTKFEKSNDEAMKYGLKLKQEITSLQSRFGIVKEETMEENNLGR